MQGILATLLDSEKKFSIILTDHHKPFVPGTDKLLARTRRKISDGQNSDQVVVIDGNDLIYRNIKDASSYPIVVNSVLTPGASASVEFAPVEFARRRKK